MPYLPIDIVNKILPRSVSWEYQDTAPRYQQTTTFTDLLTVSSLEISETGQLPENRDTVARQWWAGTVGYETRAAVKRQQTAVDKKSKYQQEITATKIKRLQSQSDPQYGDAYNRLVCERGDRENTTDLNAVNKLIVMEIAKQVSDAEIIQMLTDREVDKQKQRVLQSFNTAIPRLGNQEKAAAYALLSFELDRRKTDNTWETKIRFQDVILRGLQDESINIVTMLCTINEFNYQGGYNLNPDLNTYQQNPSVEPVPLIIV